MGGGGRGRVVVGWEGSSLASVHPPLWREAGDFPRHRRSMGAGAGDSSLFVTLPARLASGVCGVRARGRSPRYRQVKQRGSTFILRLYFCDGEGLLQISSMEEQACHTQVRSHIYGEVTSLEFRIEFPVPKHFYF